MTSENGPNAWLRIEAYLDFYDIPRMFVVEPKRGLLLVFDCAFDDTIDNYPRCFKVSVLARGVTVSDLPTDWRSLPSMTVGAVAAIPISALRFDSTRRREVLIGGLADLVAMSERLIGSSVAQI